MNLITLWKEYNESVASYNANVIELNSKLGRQSSKNAGFFVKRRSLIRHPYKEATFEGFLKWCAANNKEL